MHGDYARLVARATDKLRLSRQEITPAETGHCEQAAVGWYFAERLAAPVPEDLADYARSSGFPDEVAFRRAVRQEYQYVCGR